MRKKALCLTLSVLLLVSALPCAMAADKHWAQDAVDVLNTMYGSSKFSISDNIVTTASATALLTDPFRYAGDNVNGIAKTSFIPTGDTTQLTREKAALMVCAILRWPGVTDTSSAMNALVADGVISKKPDGTTGAADSITEPELAVIFYRALRELGMLKSRVAGMVPGEYCYFEVVYMSLRSCLPLNIAASSLTGSFSDSTAFTVKDDNNDTNPTGKQAIWEAWCKRLDQCRTEAGLAIRGQLQEAGIYMLETPMQLETFDNELDILESDSEENEESTTAVEGEEAPTDDNTFGIVASETSLLLPDVFDTAESGDSWTMGSWTASGSAPDSILDAIVQLVAEDRQYMDSSKADYFNDVASSHWAYKGVNYLMQNGVVSGTGNGQFKLGGQLTRQELAAVLSRYLNKSSNTAYAFNDGDWHESSNPTGVSDWAITSIMGITNDAQDKKYFDWNDTDKLFHPGVGVTRQQLAYVLAGLYSDYAENTVNLTVLDRFNDKSSIAPEYLAPMAYLVSIGVIRGDGSGNISPNDSVDRGTLGAMMGKVLPGLDTSKMRDYQLLVEYVKEN